MTLPPWLITAVSWAVVGTGALVVLAMCLGISIACLESALRNMGIWRTVTEAMVLVWDRRRKEKTP
ncbi:hypothetical protein [Myxococcus virescens]|uniref:Uncharacterized protein n=1 Tax=Myxococcus virescens TaxID=83456 RepID=A0A511HNN8_9BACT|nr:hypothetical protein [Myxococcus virescens]GEL75197.1 hypothetical protein MVI01_69810 [Myxococcus virescens]SDD65002.1 hypothetical protein SAMN04488504_102122 [Myxococcus virescens]